MSDSQTITKMVVYLQYNECRCLCQLQKNVIWGSHVFPSEYQNVPDTMNVFTYFKKRSLQQLGSFGTKGGATLPPCLLHRNLCEQQIYSQPLFILAKKELRVNEIVITKWRCLHDIRAGIYFSRQEGKWGQKAELAHLEPGYGVAGEM